MSELIRREDAIDAVATVYAPNEAEADEIYIAIDSVPAVDPLEDIKDPITEYLNKYDIVEVVRCRDCKWWRDDGCGDAYCRLVGVGFSRNRDGFCNYGEREGE